MKLGLIDEYRLFVSPVVLGGGTPYFHGREDHPLGSSSRALLIGSATKQSCRRRRRAVLQRRRATAAARAPKQPPDLQAVFAGSRSGSRRGRCPLSVGDATDGVPERDPG
jgi:hypothetical protein